jgi:hypothetical protein
MTRWRRYFGPMPGRREAHAMAWMAIIAGVILCGVSLALGFQGRTFLGRPLGGDFVEFYTIGKILNTLPSAEIYNLELTVRLQHEILPAMSPTQMLVFVQAPYVGWLFRPFALLPYAWAYVAWLCFTAMLYAAALAILFNTVNLSREDRKTSYLMALSWAPFLFETWIGGQMAAVVLFIFVVFVACFRRNRGFLAGLVLSLCIFKPTLVALPAAMLLAGRRWKAAAGFATGFVALGLISFTAVGWDGLRAWSDSLAMAGRFTAVAGDAWHNAKYVDLVAFVHLLVGGGAITTVIVLAISGATALLWLGRAWWRADESAWGPLLAATLCFTLVVNAYTPIYDAVLAVAAVALFASNGAQKNQEHRETLGVWLLALYMAPWLSQSFAEFLHVQLLTPILAGFGLWALAVASPGREGTGQRIVATGRILEEESTKPGFLHPQAAGRLWVRSRG